METTNNQLYVQDLTKKESPIRPIITDFKSKQNVIDTKGNNLYIYTNRNTPNYKLVKVDIDAPGPERWKE
jgi:prolyl oligopeptidase